MTPSVGMLKPSKPGTAHVPEVYRIAARLEHRRDLELPLLPSAAL